MRSGPMSGIKILDLSQVVAGPLATQMLAEQGADVIKIEPPEGELLRLGLRHGYPPLFANDNRGKHCVAVDTKQAEGRDLVLELARDADVFMENFRPGVCERLGLGEAAVRAVAPDIIYVSVTGFGPTGPYADRACLDPVIQGITGMVHGQKLKRSVRGSHWRNVGFATLDDTGQETVDAGPAGRWLRNRARPRRRFLGETFVYVVRRHVGPGPDAA